MAVNNTVKSYSKMEFPLSIKRQDAFSVDPTEIWNSLAEAQEYAKNDPTAYIGQEFSVIVDGVATRYMIKNAAGDLAPAGGVDAEAVATDDEVTELLDEIFPSSSTDENV